LRIGSKRAVGKLDGRQCYHIIQSFKPGEVTPELALEIAKEFAEEYLPDYEVVIGTHVDRGHIHSHLIFNSVNAQTGEKYHITTQEYYRQIQGISDRLCREHGLSVIMEGRSSQAVSYIEWLRQSKGQSTFRSMLEADLRSAIEDANDLGHFFMLMEHKPQIWFGNVAKPSLTGAAISVALSVCDGGSFPENRFWQYCRKRFWSEHRNCGNLLTMLSKGLG